MAKVPIRHPYINPRKGRLYPAHGCNPEIDWLADTSRTPHYKYAHGTGLYYKILRLVLSVSGYLRSRTTLWWLMVMMALFLAKYLRMTVYSDEAIKRDQMIDQTPMPTREQMNKVIGFK